MKRSLYITWLVLAVSVTVTGCTDKTPKNVQIATAPQPTNTQPLAPQYTGTVVETMNTSGYTYVMVDTGSEKIWAAAPEFQVKVGDAVIVPKEMPMKNYHSQTLNRTFDIVYFAASIKKAGAEQAAGQVAPAHSGANLNKTGVSPPVDLDFSAIKKPAGGKTIAEIYTAKSDLIGQEVIVRGKVVKFSPEIMGKNWIHLQDGTGDKGKGTNDLTITTSTLVKLGDTITVSGLLFKDKDYGYGYKYDVIIEDAKVTVE